MRLIRRLLPSGALRHASPRARGLSFLAAVFAAAACGGEMGSGSRTNLSCTDGPEGITCHEEDGSGGGGGDEGIVCSGTGCVTECAETDGGGRRCVTECENGLRCVEECAGEECSMSCTCPAGEEEPPYCETHADDPECVCKLHPDDPSCGGGEEPPYCETHPDDAECRAAYCAEHPDDPECGGGEEPPYCETHPDDAECRAAYCAEHPDSPDCV